MSAKGRTVSQVARLAHVTVRTLHHYDEIGLLTPSDRSDAGYRRYSDHDLERLQQVLFYRELGFPLDQIAVILDGRDDAGEHLRTQRRLLNERIERLRAIVAAVDTAMEARKMGMTLKPEERFEVFGNFVPEDHEEEARQRWGGSQAYAESERRVARYTTADWLQLKTEAEPIVSGLAAAMQSGLPASSAAAMDLAEQHRQHITRWFYECSLEIHAGLGEAYVADPRFAAVFETVREGLAAYVRDAIQANVARRS